MRLEAANLQSVEGKVMVIVYLMIPIGSNVSMATALISDLMQISVQFINNSLKLKNWTKIKIFIINY